MDDNRRAALMAELQEMKAEWDELKVGIQVLSKRLGVPFDADAGASSDTGQRTPEPGKPPADVDALVEMVLADEYYGQSIPKAAEAILKRWAPADSKPPIKTTALVAAMQKGGLDVDARQVYRSLWNGNKFHNIGKGKWGFMSWYSPSVLNKAKSPEEMPADDLDDETPPITDSGDGENVAPFVGRAGQAAETEVEAS